MTDNEGGTRQVRVDLIDPDESQPRKLFDQAEMVALAQSIAVHGVLQDLIVRPSPTERGRFVVVVGERRLRAAQMIDLATVPCKVRFSDERAALEAQLSENLQRQDMHPLEEGEALRRLHVDHGMTVEDLAEQYGRSEALVAQRIRLCELDSEVRAVFLAGGLTLGAAVAVARAPVAFQARVVGELRAAGGGEVIGVREAEDLIGRRYRLRLVDAPFRLGDETLYPEGGACSDCGKRTANDPNLFGDAATDDQCTDPDCYVLKADVEWSRVCERYEAAGRRVLDDDEAARLYAAGRLDPRSRYVDLDDVCPDRTGETWREALAGNDAAMSGVVIARAIGKVRALVPRRLLGDDHAPPARAAREPKVAAPEVAARPEQSIATKETPPLDRLEDALYACDDAFWAAAARAYPEAADGLRGGKHDFDAALRHTRASRAAMVSWLRGNAPQVLPGKVRK